MTISDSLQYSKNEFEFNHETGTITGYNWQDISIHIPEEIEGTKVQKLADGLFKNNTCLASVEIPSTIEEIGLTTFENCPRLIRIVSRSPFYTVQNSRYLYDVRDNSLVAFASAGLEPKKLATFEVIRQDVVEQAV